MRIAVYGDTLLRVQKGVDSGVIRATPKGDTPDVTHPF